MPVAAGVAVLATTGRGSGGFFAAGFVFVRAEVSAAVFFAVLSVVTAELFDTLLFTGASVFGAACSVFAAGAAGFAVGTSAFARGPGGFAAGAAGFAVSDIAAVDGGVERGAGGDGLGLSAGLPVMGPAAGCAGAGEGD